MSVPDQDVALRKVLIANRGEIAVRIARALAEAEITSVAIFSEADCMAHHVRMADEAYLVGPPPASESYLDQERIIQIAKRAGCDAVHPGYGFLAESAAFAEACASAGLTFIGPPPHALEVMGKKISARQVMLDAGVPVVPGGPADTLEQAKASAENVGYPIMLKPSAGGGGKGMRRIHSSAELASEWETAILEAERAFGDGSMYIEKCLQRPKHVEVQVVADRHGNALHLFERDCSIQRRQQKIIEETPCATLPRDLAERMGETSVAGALSLGYHSVGTFEYLLEPSGEFYFLEMNTRLQVEHGVTELTTGIDLVRTMLDIARGLPLAFTQSQVDRRGHAIQCRLYAESPEHDFRPSPGVIERFVLPSGPGIRVDEGAVQGDHVTSYYDPLIAKLMTWGTGRAECLQRMRRALNETSIEGLQTNLEFLRRVLESDEFVSGGFDTGFVPAHLHELLAPSACSPEVFAGVAAAAALFVDGQSHAERRSHRPQSKELPEWVRQHRSRLLGD